MLHPRDCPKFDYSLHPDRHQVLGRQTRALLTALRRSELHDHELARDTRPVHRHLFSELTPNGYDYFAGHYRGESYRCLRFYEVRIPNDPRVGFPAETVWHLMSKLNEIVSGSLAGLDASHEIPDGRLPPAEKLSYTVAVACQLFVTFLTIHPYADGNGHVGRFCIWAILGRYSYWPERWPIEPRPPNPPYLDLIRQYRDGNAEPLEEYVLQCLAA